MRLRVQRCGLLEHSCMNCHHQGRHAGAGKGPAALVLAPTRELAQQIAAVFEEAGGRAGLRALCAYGGVPKPPQAAALRRGVDVLVATPGRLEDLMQDGVCRRAARGVAGGRMHRPAKPAEATWSPWRLWRGCI